MFKPIHRYDQMHPAAHRFARVPRYGRLLSGLSANELSSITNEAQLFYTVYTKIEESPDAATGILHDGLRRPGFERFGWQNQNPVKGHMYSLWQIRLALDMLGAMAFEIMFGDTPPWNHREQIRDRIDGNVAIFLRSWAKRFINSQAYVDVLGDPIIPPLSVFADWELLVKANRHVLKHFIFSRVGKESLRFNDISTQAFLAAYWASNYVHDETDRQRLWSCIPDDWLRKRQAYAEFWGFLADMPSSAYHQHQKLAPAKKCWEELLSPIFDKEHPFAPKDDNGNIIRASKLIYHAWDRMQDTAAGRVFRGEFAAILRDEKEKFRQQTAQQMLAGFYWSRPLSIEEPRTSDVLGFVMGCSEGHSAELVRYSHLRANIDHGSDFVQFWILTHHVKNIEFELYEQRRAFGRDFIFSFETTNLFNRPVTTASWYDAACFAMWIGQVQLENSQRVLIILPTKAQLQKAVRNQIHHTRVCGTDFQRSSSSDNNESGRYFWSLDGDESRQLRENVEGQPGEPSYDTGQAMLIDGRMSDGTVGGDDDLEGFWFCGDYQEWVLLNRLRRIYHDRINLESNSAGSQWITWPVPHGLGRFGYETEIGIANGKWEAPIGSNGRVFYGFRLAAVPLGRIDEGGECVGQR